MAVAALNKQTQGQRLANDWLLLLFIDLATFMVLEAQQDFIWVHLDA